MAGLPIVFRFDFISPYAYLAWTRIHALAERHGRDVQPVPILFAALLNAHGHKGPAEIAPKRDYVFKDAYRRAHLEGVPFWPPPTHPFNPLLALRAVHASGMHRGFIDALFGATWGTDGPKGVEDPAVVEACAASAGLDGRALVAKANDPGIKNAVRAATDLAIALGVFGVPTMSVGDEHFWGFDSLPLLEQHLRGEDPVTPALLASVRGLRASAKR